MASLSSDTVANIRNFGRGGLHGEIKPAKNYAGETKEGIPGVDYQERRGLFDSVINKIPGVQTSRGARSNVYQSAYETEQPKTPFSKELAGLEAILPTLTKREDISEAQKRIQALKILENREVRAQEDQAAQTVTARKISDAIVRESGFIEQTSPLLENMLLGNKQELSDEDKLLSIIFASPETTNAKRREILINVKKARDVTLAGREQQLSYLEALSDEIKKQPEIENMIDSLKDKSVDKFEAGQITNAIERSKNNIEKTEFLNGLTKSIEKPNSKPLLKEIKENIDDGLYDVTHAKRLLEAIRKSDLDKRPEKLNIQSHTLNNEIVDTGYDKRGRLVYYDSSRQIWELLPKEGTRVGKGPTNISRKSHSLNGELVTTGLRKVGNVTEEVYLNKETGTWEALPKTAEIATTSSTKSVKGRITTEERKDFGEFGNDGFEINNKKVKALFRRAGVDFKTFEDYGKTGVFDLEVDLEDEEIEEVQKKYIEDVILEARRLENEENIQYNRALIKAIKTISIGPDWSVRQITDDD
tara:strand:- start:2319 stop:3911 length:1593 start_codon:yes stop_codon:yes gene_type:complete